VKFRQVQGICARIKKSQVVTLEKSMHIVAVLIWQLFKINAFYNNTIVRQLPHFACKIWRF